MRPFAGMGSVNEVALYKDSVLAIELNRDFDALRVGCLTLCVLRGEHDESA